MNNKERNSIHSHNPKSNSPTKKVITLNIIQAKMKKRKFKTTRGERTSIDVLEQNTTFHKFKKELKKNLKVEVPKAVTKPKERYTTL